MTERPAPPASPRLAGWVAVAALAHAGVLGALAAMAVPELAPPGEAPGVELVVGDADAGGEAGDTAGGTGETVPSVEAPAAEEPRTEMAQEDERPALERSAEVPAASLGTATADVTPEAVTAVDPLTETMADVMPERDAAEVEATPADVAEAMPRTGSADVQEAPPAVAMTWPAALPPRVTARPPPARRSAVTEEKPAGGAGRAADAGAAPGAAGAAGGGEADPRDIAAWQAALSAWISRNQTYPQAARHLHTEGVVQVRFVMDAAGRVTSVAVTRESGSAALDAAALALLRDAQLPPPPARMSADRRVVTVPIRYRLQ